MDPVTNDIRNDKRSRLAKAVHDSIARKNRELKWLERITSALISHIVDQRDVNEF